MPRNIPNGLDETTRRAFTNVWEYLEELESGNASLNQRRFASAGQAVGQDEFVTKQQLEEAIQLASVSPTGVRNKTRLGGSIGPVQGAYPPPNHPIDFGYFYTDGKFGEFFDEVSGYTNMHYVWAYTGYGTSEDTREEWIEKMRQSALRAADAGKVIYFNAGQEISDVVGDLRDVIWAIREAWSSVKYVSLADEPENAGWGGASEVDTRMRRLFDVIEELGLPFGDIKFGCGFTHDAVLEGDWVDAETLDFVGIETYVTAPGGTAEQNAATINGDIDAMMSRISSDKFIEIVQQAYDRNGYWTNIDTLTRIQDVPYLRIKDEQRVLLMNLFSYGRQGGTHDHPELAVVHRKISAALQGIASPFSFPTQGRKKVRARAYMRRVVDALNGSVHANRSILNPEGVPVLTSWADGVTLRDDVLARLATVRTIRARAHPSDGRIIEITGTGNNKFHEAYYVFGQDLSARIIYAYTESPNKVR